MSVIHDRVELVQGGGHRGAVALFKAFKQGNPRCAARLEGRGRGEKVARPGKAPTRAVQPRSLGQQSRRGLLRSGLLPGAPLAGQLDGIADRYFGCR